MNNVLDLVKNGNAVDSRVAMVEEAIKGIPEIGFFEAFGVKGSQFQALRHIANAVAQFRKAGEGTDTTGSTYELATFNLGILDGVVAKDKAVIDADFRGRDAALATEAAGMVHGGLVTLAKAIWGATTAVEGFDGAKALVSANMTLDAGSSATNTWSLYCVGNGAANGCAITFENGKGILAEGDIEFKEQLITGSNSKQLMGYVADITSWAGFACTNGNKIARYKGFDVNGVTSGKFLTDAILGEIVDLYEETNGVRPDAIFMPFQLRQQLQASRSLVAKLTSGLKTQANAGTPTDYEGVQIIATANIEKDVAA